MSEYRYVGNIYHGYAIFEGKVIMDDHFLVVDEYVRPLTPNDAGRRHALLMSMRSGQMHEVPGFRLDYGPHYRRVA